MLVYDTDKYLTQHIQQHSNTHSTSTTLSVEIIKLIYLCCLYTTFGTNKFRCGLFENIKVCIILFDTIHNYTYFIHNIEPCV